MENKKQLLKNIDLYFITDRKLSKKTVIEDVKAAVKGGVKIVQYREIELPKEDRIKETKEIKKICDENNVLFIINNDVDVALEVNADGVHLGQDDIPYKKARKLLGDKIIGLTVHNVKEAVEAEQLGADYIGVSPIFETKTKPDAGPAAGLKLIKEVKEKIKIPFVAIGGINKENLRDVLRAGAKSIVAISAIVGKDNVEKEVKEFINIIKQYKSQD